MTDAYGIPKPTRVPRSQHERQPNVFKPYRDDIPRGSHERQTSLKPIGRRAKRLAADDKAVTDLIHDKACICGCNADPLNGEVCRVHLESRRYEETRNELWNNLPGCLSLNRWLDSDPYGVQCRAVLLEMATYKWAHHGEVLTHAEVWPELDKAFYWNWKAKFGR